ncbi:MAG TPA: alpha/beta fold hydrolase [Actinomycetes bacterium]|nr:alpha/beta fold hydrolase [Actinomycetes bacterium]
MGADRFGVRSADGAPLAVWVEGQGPPLVLVHGSMCDHTASDPLVAELRDTMTTFAMDRRGFGASGDAAGYALEREFEDVAAVVEAVAARTGGPVALWGHSYGAGCAMGGAALTGAVHHLVLYEPGLGIPYPAGSIEEVEAALAADDAETALLLVLAGVVGMTDEEIASLRSGPRWPTMLASAPTVPRECRAEDGWTYRPGAFDGLSAPTLLLAGTESHPVLQQATDRALAAIPGARVQVLEGHAHLAHRSDPAMVAAVIRGFVSGSAAASGARPGARTRPG